MTDSPEEIWRRNATRAADGLRRILDRETAKGLPADKVAEALGLAGLQVWADHVAPGEIAGWLRAIADALDAAGGDMAAAVAATKPKMH